jgi:hypothetical protein
MSGGHELVLSYAVTDGNPVRAAAVLFRRLRIVKLVPPNQSNGGPSR